MEKRTLTLLVVLLCSLHIKAQNLSNTGKEFWVGYGHHQFMEPGEGNGMDMVIYLSAEQPATVTVSLDGTTWTNTYTIPANTVIATPPIPKAGTFDARLYSQPPAFGGTGGEGIFQKKGIHIVSDVPIVAYAHIYGSASSGATMLMPVETWGYYYVSLNSEQNYADDCFSWMYVVAKDNNTVIEITPAKLTRNNRPAGTPFTVTLNKGEIYQLIGASLGGGAGNELTGTTVRSIANSNDTCFPVAVFSGSSRTSIACTGNFGSSGDNNMQQVFPSQAWGKRYLTAPLSNSGSANSLMTNIYKVVVKDPTTVVKRNGTIIPASTLIGNAYYRFESGTADYITADKPVLLAQFMSSEGACPNMNGEGDPEMIYLSPIEQSIKRIGFYRNTQQFIDVNYLTLIIPTAGMSSLTIDGVPNGWSYAYTHPNLPGYSVIVKRWGSAQAQCIVQSDSAFTAVTYGEGSVESYGYNAGTLINNLNVIGAIHNQQDTSDIKNDYTCTQTPVELSVLLAYQPTDMLWLISQLGSEITPNADVHLVAPVNTGTELVNGVPYYKYTLPGTYKFSNTGTYEITIQNTNPSIEKCDHKEDVKINVTVKQKPNTGFTFTHTGCTMDTVYFKGDSSNGNFVTDRWKWTFPGNVQDSDQYVKHKFPVGQQNVQLSVVSKEGCLADTIIPITVVAPPTAAFTTDVNALCEGGQVTVTDNSTFAGSAPINTWYWNYGNNKADTLTANTAKTITYPAYGTYTIAHVVKVSDLCVSDTAKETVNVYAKPSLGITYPNSCLDASGLVQFTSTTTVPDAQTLSSYSWDFGDAAATNANPDTSTLANPQHTYINFGTYNIKYSATTDQGCTRDTTISATFNLKPALAFATLAPVCEAAKSGLTVAKGSVTNGVKGTGIYKGAGVSPDGTFNPALAGAGTHAVWYVFTTDSGCVDSISTNIVVNPRPVANFSATADVCFGAEVTITDQSTISSGNITSWTWLPGNGPAVVRTDNTPFTEKYNTAKSYTIKMVATSDNGCTSDTATQTVTVHSLPTVNFTMPASICMPDGHAAFVNNSTGESLTYQWNFGDGSATVADVSPTHIYTASGPYTVSLKATSAAGCTTTKTQQLTAFYNQPVANFSVAPDTLCQGTDNHFTDQSTDDKSTITTWSWTFGDGNSSTDQNPVKRYSAPGDYNVQLVVTNAAGCTSTPYNSNVVVYLQPVIDAGQSFIVSQGTIITFTATANDSTELSFIWSPADGLSDPTALSPTLDAQEDQVYTLTAIGKGSCTATDDMKVKVFKPVNVPNAFSPNGDGINDTWVIPNLADYPGCTIEVFNRYGQKVFSSTGYDKPWDGTFNGHLLPMATYYYVIKLKNGYEPQAGYVTILF
jgi:gliding motility-associated-like protein